VLGRTLHRLMKTGEYGDTTQHELVSDDGVVPLLDSLSDERVHRRRFFHAT